MARDTRRPHPRRVRPKPVRIGKKSTGCLMAIPAVAAGVVAGFGVVLAVLGLVNGGWYA